MAWSGPSTRLVSADNTRCDGHQHICRKSRSTPAAIIYGITLRLPCTANVHQAALIFIGTRSLQMYNTGSCRILSASVLFSVYAFNEKKLFLPHSEKRWNEAAMSKHLLHLLHILDVHHAFYDELDILPVVDLHLDCPFEDAVVTGDGYLADVDAQLIGKHIGNVV